MARKTAEERAATKRTYIAAHPEIYRRAKERYRAELRADPQRWRATLNQQAEYWKTWAKTDAGRDSRRIYRQRQRASRRAAAGAAGGVTRGQWLELCDAYRDDEGCVRCAYCFAVCKPTIDHVVAISAGGAHDISNAAPACAWCNTSKGARPLREWLGLGGHAYNYAKTLGPVGG